MVKGIGIDIIEIDRIAKAISRNEKFLERIFTASERAYFSKNNYAMHTIAGNFAAKEAVMKAMGTGLRRFKWIDIEILRDHLGKPYVHLYNHAKTIADQNSILQIMVAISHSREYAVAHALAV